MTSEKTESLLWVDLGTTGLEPQECDILEIYMLLTDMRGNIWFRQPIIGDVPVFDYGAVVQQKDLIHRQHEWNPYAYNMHTTNGLISESAGLTARSLHDVRAQVVSSLASLAKHHTMYLAGSSVHFDRSFLKLYWPEMFNHVHYRQLDVTSLELAMLACDLPVLELPKAHRAKDDVERSIQIYRQIITQEGASS